MNRFRAPMSAAIVCLLLMISLLVVSPSSAAFLTFVELQKDGLGGVDGLDGTYSVAVAPDGKNVYAAGLIDSAVVVFSRNATTGALTFVELRKDGVGGVDGLFGARAVAISPDGKHVYVASALDNAVAAFSRNATTGALTFIEMQKDGVGGVDGLAYADSAVVSLDGNYLYITGANDNAVAVFSRNATTGALTFVEMQKDGVGGVDGLAYADSAVVSLDGKHVYVAGRDDNAVAVFSRNATTGALTFVEVQKDGVGGVDGLFYTQSVTTSPDDKNIYATGISSVVVFSRNTTTGALTFVEVQKDGVSGVDGLAGAASVAVSSDGQHIYTAGGLDNAVAAFSRNATTGALTFVEMQRDGVGGVDGINDVQSVAVSSDNAHVYTAGVNDDAVAVFRAGAGSPPTDTPTTMLTGTPGPDYLPLILKQLPPPTPTPISSTPTMGPQPGGPPFSNVLHLDGADDYATAPDSSNLDIGDDASESLTVEAWFLADNVNPSPGRASTIADKFNSYRFYISLRPQGENDCVALELYDTRFSSFTSPACTSSITAGWHHVAGVFNHSDFKVSLYLDGRRLGEPFSYPRSTVYNSEGDISVGGPSIAGFETLRLAGQIEELRISVSARYTGTTYTVPKRLTCDAQTRALWHFDETVGATTMYDGEDAGSTNCGGVEDSLIGSNGAATGP
jgi:6-phosphogluconolactonase (cycloisomerase 2 family)